MVLCGNRAGAGGQPRAGRERYEQIKRQANKAWNNPTVKGNARQIKRAAQLIRFDHAAHRLAAGHAAAALIPTFLWSLGLVPHVDPGSYRLLYWGFGHGAQQVNLAAMVAVWYLLAAITTGAKPLNEKLSRTAFVLGKFLGNVVVLAAIVSGGVDAGALARSFACGRDCIEGRGGPRRRRWIGRSTSRRVLSGGWRGRWRVRARGTCS